MQSWPPWSEQRQMAWAATAAGRLTLALVYTAILSLLFQSIDRPLDAALSLGAVLVAIAVRPDHKYKILGLAFLAWMWWPNSAPNLYRATFPLLEQFPALRALPFGVSTLALALAAAAFCLAYRAWVAGMPESGFIRRRAFYLLICLYFVLMLTLMFGPLTEGAVNLGWNILFALSAVVMFMGFELQTLGRTPRLRGVEWGALFQPLWRIYFFWPVKGEMYLRSVEAKSVERFAAVQVKGLKLLTWALVLKLGNMGFQYLAFQGGLFAIPTVEQALYFRPGVQKLPVWLAWTVVYAEFFNHFWIFAIMGHLKISLVRMSGFDVFRNTYRPFQARSVNEFFGRYNYYFKEMLLHLFFYPVYLRWFKRHPRLAVVLATFVSVGLGNLVTHLIRDTFLFRKMGLAGTLWFYQPYSLYCLVLSFALTFSILWEAGESDRGRERPVGFFRRALPLFLIITFFAILRIFDDPFNGDLSNNLRLLKNLVGL
jgi:hypothetical protein